MKVTLLIIICFFVSGQIKLEHKKTGYLGLWVCDQEKSQAVRMDTLSDKDGNFLTDDGYLEICSKSVSWPVFSNQLYMFFEPKMKGDTLLLLYKSNDVGRGFWNYKGWPIVNKPFAKLYRYGNNTLRIVYLNNAFVKAMKRFPDSPEEKKLIFPTVVYLNKKEKPICE